MACIAVCNGMTCYSIKINIVIMKTKVCNDGFMWLVLSRKQAFALWLEGSTEIYKLYDDETEGACESIEDLFTHNVSFGIELGFVNDIVPAHIYKRIIHNT